MSKESIIRFREKLNSYIKQVDSSAEVFLIPDPTIGYPFEGMTEPEGIVYIHFYTQEEMELEELYPEYVYVVLAHEAGHVEQYRDIHERRRGFIPPPTELDAWKRGIKWAHKWGVLERYRMEFVIRGALELILGAPHFIREDFERIKLQIDKLLRSR